MATSIWHGRSIYFALVDRFAMPPNTTTDDNASRVCAGNGWCGGTIAGLTEKLDYLSDLVHRLEFHKAVEAHL